MAIVFENKYLDTYLLFIEIDEMNYYRKVQWIFRYQELFIVLSLCKYNASSWFHSSVNSVHIFSIDLVL